MTLQGAQGLPELGKTYYGDLTIDASNFGNTVGLEGEEASMDNIDPSTVGSNTRSKRNGKRRIARLVRNTSGGALLPGAVVSYEAGFHGRRVDAVSGAAGEFAGIVDENLPAAGVKANDLFWIFIEGECLCNKTSTDVLAEGSFVATGATGLVTTAVTIDVDGSHVGRVVTAAGNPSAQVLVHLKASH